MTGDEKFTSATIFLATIMVLSSIGFVAGGSHVRRWVETCWPNKPVWTEGPGVCWVNGQKVVVE